jgi:hypothetical protein
MSTHTHTHIYTHTRTRTRTLTTHPRPLALITSGICVVVSVIGVSSTPRLTGIRTHNICRSDRTCINEINKN